MPPQPPPDQPDAVHYQPLTLDTLEEFSEDVCKITRNNQKLSEAFMHFVEVVARMIDRELHEEDQ